MLSFTRPRTWVRFPPSPLFTAFPPALRRCCALARQAIEQVGEGFGVFNHRKVPAGYLDRLDAQQLVCHEALPRRLEDLIVGGVDQDRRDVGMAGARIFVGWGERGA